MADRSYVADLFANGRIVDCILALMLVEAALLIFVNYRWHRGISPSELILKLAAGAGLMFALRAALLRAAWPVIAAWLVFSLGAHVGEMSLRWAASRRP